MVSMTTVSVTQNRPILLQVQRQGEMSRIQERETAFVLALFEAHFIKQTESFLRVEQTG